MLINSSTHIHPYIQHIAKGEALLRQQLSSFQLAEVNVELARLQHFFVSATAKRQTGDACWTASSIAVGCKTKMYQQPYQLSPHIGILNSIQDLVFMPETSRKPLILDWTPQQQVFSWPNQVLLGSQGCTWATYFGCLAGSECVILEAATW